jgi:hypothetical protein
MWLCADRVVGHEITAGDDGMALGDRDVRKRTGFQVFGNYLIFGVSPVLAESTRR